ncbi:MAG: substrate-binding domain-containing protein [Catenulispora sp.]|nr:substrate-binding domain-containing protein [Catenulispora sp.]
MRRGEPDTAPNGRPDAPGGAATRPPSQADVAALAGVSSQTVSRVVSGRAKVEEATRRRVVDAMQILGYRANTAARALATGRFHTIGVLGFTFGAHGNARTLQAISEQAQDAGYSVTVMTVRRHTEGALREAVTALGDQAVDGIVLIDPQILDRPGLELPTGVPVVISDGNPDRRYPSVNNDQTAGARGAVDHLLGLGHRTVWHLAGPRDSYAAQQRAAAWHAALKAAGVPIPPIVYGDWSAQSGYEAGRAIATAGEATAVFAANDHMALGLMRALDDAGVSVPGDLSVVGFDDVAEAAFFKPPLTTVHYDFEQLGRECVSLLLRLIAEPSADARVAVAPTPLIVRGSTAPPPSRAGGSGRH